MRKVLSVVLEVVAGFFFYMVDVLGFIHAPSPGVKWGLMAGFTVPALLALCGGLALTRFREWKRDSGIVLLSSSGFTVLLVFMCACLLMTEDFRRMLKPDTLVFFSDYFTGGAVVLGFAGLGLLALRFPQSSDGGAGEGAGLPRP